MAELNLQFHQSCKTGSFRLACKVQGEPIKFVCKECSIKDDDSDFARLTLFLPEDTVGLLIGTGEEVSLNINSVGLGDVYVDLNASLFLPPKTMDDADLFEATSWVKSAYVLKICQHFKCSVFPKNKMIMILAKLQEAPIRPVHCAFQCYPAPNKIVFPETLPTPETDNEQESLGVTCETKKGKRNRKKPPK